MDPVLMYQSFISWSHYAIVGPVMSVIQKAELCNFRGVKQIRKIGSTDSFPFY